MTTETSGSEFTPSTMDVKAAYAVAGTVGNDYAQRFQKGLPLFGEEFMRWLTEHDRAVAEKTLLDYADLLDSPTYTMNYKDAESMLTQIIGLLRRDAPSFRSVPKENKNA